MFEVCRKVLSLRGPLPRTTQKLRLSLFQHFKRGLSLRDPLRRITPNYACRCYVVFVYFSAGTHGRRHVRYAIRIEHETHNTLILGSESQFNCPVKKISLWRSGRSRRHFITRTITPALRHDYALSQTHCEHDVHHKIYAIRLRICKLFN